MSTWIKMGTGLASHGKVKALRRALKADRLKVIGGLWAVWCVFDEHSAAGQLDGYTLDDMDEEIGWRGFSAAMRDIGWLIETDDGLEAPDYEEHNGPNAKRRATDASRKGKSRAKADTETDLETPPDPHEYRTPNRTEPGQVSASDADNLRNREEKRREEEEKNQRHSEPDGSGAEAPPADPPPLQAAEAPPDPADVIFGLGLPLLTAANVSDRNARSMLGLMRKTHGNAAVIRALQRCATEKPLQPVAWLQAALKAPGGGAAPTQPKGDRIALGNIDTVRKFAERTMP
jgi:hypothetical protein